MERILVQGPDAVVGQVQRFQLREVPEGAVWERGQNEVDHAQLSDARPARPPGPRRWRLGARAAMQVQRFQVRRQQQGLRHPLQLLGLRQDEGHGFHRSKDGLWQHGVRQLLKMNEFSFGCAQVMHQLGSIEFILTECYLRHIKKNILAQHVFTGVPLAILQIVSFFHMNLESLSFCERELPASTQTQLHSCIVQIGAEES